MMEHHNILPFINPATGLQYGEMVASTEQDVAQAISDLRHALSLWQQKTAAERTAVLRKFKEHLIDQADEISAVLNKNCGKTRQDGLVEVFITVDNLHNMIKHAPRWLERIAIPRGLYFFKRYYAEPIPFGVVAVIGPWNYPVVQVLTPVLAALAAGNVVIIKPSEVAPAVGLLFAQLFAAVPEIAPYVRVVHGGPEVGRAVVNTPPDLIFVTGSEGTGKAIQRAAADTLTPVITELGGKDAMLVLADADIQAAAKWGVWGAFYHSGQVCMSVERVYVVEAVYDKFVAAVKQEAAQFKIGYTPDIDSPYNCGPITFPRQVDIINEHLADAQEKGAEIIIGGQVQGMFVDPTVLINVTHDMQIMREETFGPTLPIMKVKDEAEAIRLANDSKYGLCAYVWSRDLRHAEQVGRQLEAGTIVTNDAMAHYAVSQLPFGGIKKSGNGRIHGRDEVIQFTQLKGYAVGPAPLPFDIATILRQPNRYKEMKMLMQLVFGSWRQKLEIFKKEASLATEASPLVETAQTAGKAALVFGAVAATAVVLFNLTRRAKG